MFNLDYLNIIRTYNGYEKHAHAVGFVMRAAVCGEGNRVEVGSLEL